MNKFKIDDIVVIHTDCSGNYTGFKEDAMFKIVEISDQRAVYLRPEKGRTTGIISESCRLATQEEIKAYNDEIRNIKAIKLQFEKGKWYKSEGLTDDIMEFDKIIGDKFYYTRRVKDKLFFPNSDWSNIHWYKDYEVSEVPLSEIQQYLPKEELTSLPEKWCVKVIGGYTNNLEISNWADRTWANAKGYICYTKTWIYDKPDYTEITFDQFKKWVLKENQEFAVIDFKSKTKEQEIEDLIEEAKRRYPVGTKYKTVCKNHEYIVHNNHKLKFGWNNGDNIYFEGAPHTNNFIYQNGKWAEIIEPVKFSNNIEIALTGSNIASLKEKPINLTASYRKEFEGHFLLYNKELSLGNIWKQHPLSQKECIAIQKITGLEHQKPVIIKLNKKKSKLIIINQNK